MSRQTKKWRGTSMNDICNGKGPWSFSVTPLNPSKYHSVLYELPATLQRSPKPHRSKDIYLWDDDHVRMPFCEKNLFCISENSSDVIKERWKIITEVYSSPINSFDEFEAAVNKYNSCLPKFEALRYYLNEECDDPQSQQFFTNLLPKIISLALKLPQLLPNGIPLLQQNHNRSLSMSQLQVACILANAFLCTFPWKKSTAVTYPGVNFVGLFSCFGRPDRKQCMCEKLNSICHYFRRVTQNEPTGVITFERKMIPRSSMPRWDKMDNNLGNTKIHITSEGTIEDNGVGLLQIDFANKNIGGGVLRYGCVQEEIRFVICPELIVSRLFVEQLGNGEAVIITGAERYSNYTGYGDTFEWAGDHQDETPYDVYCRRRTTICVIDATRFNKSKDQFGSSMIIRELNKAYVGFSSREKDNLAPIATGNWGCGAFQGSKNLKTLIQLMACTAANRDLVYYSFGDEELMDNFHDFHAFLGSNQITITQLWRFLCQFSLKNLSEDQLYSFIQQAFFDSKRQPTISQFFKKVEATSSTEPNASICLKKKDEHGENKPRLCGNKKLRDSSPDFPSLFEPAKSNECSEHSPKRNKTEHNRMELDSQNQSTSHEEPSPSNGETSRYFRRSFKQKSEKTVENVLKKMPSSNLEEIFDMLDGNCNQQTNTVADSKQEVLASFDKFKAKLTNEDDLEEVVVDKMEIDNTKEHQKGVKKKISDYFSLV